MPFNTSRHFSFRRIRNSRSIPKCLNSSCCAFRMMALASRSFSSARRCSYQPIASASSMSDVIMRANVRVFAESSPGGSWYWSNPIRPPWRREERSSRLESVHCSRKGYRFPDVMDSRYPRNRPLQPEPEAGMYERPVLSEIEVPVVRLNGKILPLDASQQLVVIVLALRATDYLPVAFRGEQIIAQHRPRIVRILLHVE